MTVTTSDIQKIIENSRIQIDFPYPLAPERKWYMRQPKDWEYDFSMAVRDSADAAIRNEPSFKAISHLPPSAEWIARQAKARADTEQRIADLIAKGKALGPEESLELEKQRDYLARLDVPKGYTRGDEIASKHSRQQFETWLIPRLLVDEGNNQLFDLSTQAGQVQWDSIDIVTKRSLRSAFYLAIDLILTAKN